MFTSLGVFCKFCLTFCYLLAVGQRQTQVPYHTVVQWGSLRFCESLPFLPHNCNFVIIMNYNVKYPLCESLKGL